jgi:hypothetical protein
MLLHDSKLTLVCLSLNLRGDKVFQINMLVFNFNLKFVMLKPEPSHGHTKSKELWELWV